MKTLGYYNGTYDELDRMMVPMNDRVCYFGDGVYDAGPCRNYHIFAIDEHIDRFFKNAALLEIRMPCTKAELKALLQELVQKLDTGDLFVYYQVTRGTGMRDHPFTEGTGNLWVTLKPAAPPQLAEKIRLITMEDTRFYHCNIKTLNLIPSVIAYQRCTEAGCQETVFHRGERVTECAHSNVLMIKDGVLCTPPRDNLILPGITLKHLLELAETNGIPTREAVFTMDELRAADEVIISSSGGLCIAADELDGNPIGGKDPVTLKKLQDAYTAFYEKDTNY